LAAIAALVKAGVMHFALNLGVIFGAAAARAHNKAVRPVLLLKVLAGRVGIGEDRIGKVHGANFLD
jgi:hypothetical protein